MRRRGDTGCGGIKALQRLREEGSNMGVSVECRGEGVRVECEDVHVHGGEVLMLRRGSQRHGR